jgi:hypothetical protein
LNLADRLQDAIQNAHGAAGELRPAHGCTTWARASLFSASTHLGQSGNC